MTMFLPKHVQRSTRHAASELHETIQSRVGRSPFGELGATVTTSVHHFQGALSSTHLLFLVRLIGYAPCQVVLGVLSIKIASK